MSDLQELQASSRREELLNRLSPKEAAIFRFVERLLEVEKAPRSEGEPKVAVSWQNGMTTERIIEDALSGYKYQLPTPGPSPENYESFGWVTGYDFDLKKRREFPSSEAYEEAFPSKGSGDIRIFDLGNYLKFYANLGSFKGTERDWAKMFDEEDYPVVVEDRQGFQYSNPSYKTLKNKSKS